MKLDWKKFETCAHEHLTDYYATGRCGTPLCGGWTESHCRDCGAFISECPCGAENGASAWSWRRHKVEERRRRKAVTV